jgi:hypothetical protein
VCLQSVLFSGDSEEGRRLVDRLPGRLLLHRRRYNWGDSEDCNNDETAFHGQEEDDEESDDSEDDCPEREGAGEKHRRAYCCALDRPNASPRRHRWHQSKTTGGAFLAC